MRKSQHINTVASIAALNMLLTSSKEPLTSQSETHSEVQRMYTELPLAVCTSAKHVYKLLNASVYKLRELDFIFDESRLQFDGSILPILFISELILKCF